MKNVQIIPWATVLVGKCTRWEIELWENVLYGKKKFVLCTVWQMKNVQIIPWVTVLVGKCTRWENELWENVRDGEM
jgi:hypothetical protein